MSAKRQRASRRTGRRCKQFKPLDSDDISEIAKRGPTNLTPEQMERLRWELNRSIAIRHQMHRVSQELQPRRNGDTLKKLQTGIKLVTGEILKIWSHTGYNALSELPSSYRESAEIYLDELVKNEFEEDMLDFFHQVYGPLCSMLDAAKLAEEQQLARRNGKQHPKSRDWVRYIFIEELAEIYQCTFRKQPSLTRDGPWCCFLAEVLSRCEQSQIGASGALDLYRKVKREKLRKTFFSRAEPRVRAKALEREEFWKGVRSGRDVIVDGPAAIRGQR